MNTMIQESHQCHTQPSFFLFCHVALLSVLLVLDHYQRCCLSFASMKGGVGRIKGTLEGKVLSSLAKFCVFSVNTIVVFQHVTLVNCHKNFIFLYFHFRISYKKNMHDFQQAKMSQQLPHSKISLLKGLWESTLVKRISFCHAFSPSWFSSSADQLLSLQINYDAKPTTKNFILNEQSHQPPTGIKHQLSLKYNYSSGIYLAFCQLQFAHLHWSSLATFLRLFLNT